jgi:hypothetical protein
MLFPAGDNNVKRRNYYGYSKYRGGRQYAKYDGEYPEHYDAVGVSVYCIYSLNGYGWSRNAPGQPCRIYKYYASQRNIR